MALKRDEIQKFGFIPFFQKFPPFIFFFLFFLQLLLKSEFSSILSIYENTSLQIYKGISFDNNNF